MAQTTKTNNSYLADKVALRVAHLPDREVLRVMDCYAGSGVVWSAVKKLTGRRIAVLPIDISADVDGFHLAGDNKQYLETMDLSRFDVIDLDAYGVPYDQLKIVLDRGFHGTVFVTFIQSVFGTLPNTLLVDLGFSLPMIEKSPALFGARGWQYFCEWMALRGVTSFWHRHHARKHYIGFVV
jgi:hypothetical protein